MLKPAYVAPMNLLAPLESSNQAPTFVCCPTLTTSADTAKTGSCPSGYLTPFSLWWVRWLELLSLNIACRVESSWLYFFCGYGLADVADCVGLFSIWLPFLSSCYSSSLLMLAQAFLVFLTMWLSCSVNYDLRECDAFPGEFILLLYRLNDSAREDESIKAPTKHLL